MRAARPARRARGAALVTTLMALIVVTAVGVAVTSHTVRALADARLDLRRAAARLAAEGAVEAARAALSRDPAWTGGAVDVEAARALTVVSPGAAAGERRVVATARVAPSGGRGPAVQAVVEATLVLGGGLPRVASWRER